MFASTALIFLLVASALTLGMSLKRIPEGQVYTLRRLGSTAPRLLKPGMHWVWPVVEHITHRISLVGRALDLDARDDRGHALHGTIYWQVLEPERADAVIERAEALIQEAAADALPTLGSMQGEAECSQALKLRLNSVLAPHGIFIARTRVRPDA